MNELRNSWVDKYMGDQYMYTFDNFELPRTHSR